MGRTNKNILRKKLVLKQEDIKKANQEFIQIEESIYNNAKTGNVTEVIKSIKLLFKPNFDDKIFLKNKLTIIYDCYFDILNGSPNINLVVDLADIFENFLLKYKINDINDFLLARLVAEYYFQFGKVGKTVNILETHYNKIFGKEDNFSEYKQSKILSLKAGIEELLSMYYINYNAVKSIEYAWKSLHSNMKFAQLEKRPVDNDKKHVCFFNLGQAHYMLGKFDQAYQYFNHAYSLENDVKILDTMQEILFITKKNDAKTFKEYIKESVSSIEGLVFARKYAADYLKDVKDFSSKDSPHDNPNNLIYISIESFNQGNITKSEDLFKSIKQEFILEDNNIDNITRMIKLYELFQDYNGAEKLVDQALKKFGYSIFVQLIAIEFYFIINKFDKVIEVYNKYFDKEDKDNPSGLGVMSVYASIILSKAYFTIGQFDKSLDIAIKLEKEIDVNIVNKDLSLLLQHVILSHHIRLKQYKKAEDKIQEIKKIYVKDKLYLDQHLEWIYYTQKKYIEHIECCPAILKLDPDNATIWFRKGLSHYFNHQEIEAVECFVAAIKINPRYHDKIKNYLQLDLDIDSKKFTPLDKIEEVNDTKLIVKDFNPQSKIYKSKILSQETIGGYWGINYPNRENKQIHRIAYQSDKSKSKVFAIIDEESKALKKLSEDVLDEFRTILKEGRFARKKGQSGIVFMKDKKGNKGAKLKILGSKGVGDIRLWADRVKNNQGEELYVFNSMFKH